MVHLFIEATSQRARDKPKGEGRTRRDSLARLLPSELQPSNSRIYFSPVFFRLGALYSLFFFNLTACTSSEFGPNCAITWSFVPSIVL
jgi:hypothetical protein